MVLFLQEKPTDFLIFFWGGAKSCFCWTDSTIQKLKQQYNRSGGPALEVTFAEVEENLRIHPPKEISLDDVEFNNGLANGHTEHSTASGKVV